MIKLTDTEKNTEIVYLYVNHFKWLDTASNENAMGHPKERRVYRAVRNKDTNSYRVFFRNENDLLFVYLEALTATQSENPFQGPNYQAEIVELTKHNILEHDILEEDLDEFLKWIAEDNGSLKKAMNIMSKKKEKKKDEPGIVDGKELVKAIQIQQEGQEFFREAQYFFRLKEVEPLLYDAMLEIVLKLIDRGNGDPGTLFGYSKTLGAGKNITRAMEALEVYGGDDRRTNLHSEDLFVAIRSLLAEQARRQYHNVTDE